MRRLLTLCIPIVLFLPACKKEEPLKQANQYTHYLNQSLDGFRFREGSYWVYYNPLTAQTDSLVVEQLNEGFETYYDNSTGNTPPDEVRVQFHDVVLTSQDYTYTEHLYLANNSIYTTAYHPDYPDQNTPLYFSSTAPGDTTNGAYVVAVHDSMLVCCTVFNNVVQMRYDNPLVHWSDPQFTGGELYYVDYYWVDGVGIVRKEIFDGSGGYQIWDLVNFSIEM